MGEYARRLEGADYGELVAYRSCRFYLLFFLFLFRFSFFSPPPLPISPFSSADRDIETGTEVQQINLQIRGMRDYRSQRSCIVLGSS